MFLINCVFIGLLILCLLPPLINPNTTTLFSVIGLAYPVLVLINLAFVLMWLFFRNYRFLYSTVTIIILFVFGNSLVTFNSSSSNSDLTVISFNCKLLGLYDDNLFSDELREYLNESEADVICLQEFYNFKEKRKSILSKFKEELNFKTVRFTAKVEGNMNKQLGLLFISKHSIIKTGRIPFNTVTSNLCTYTDIAIKDKPLRIYNAHLQSLRLSRNDHKFIENPEQKKVVEKGKTLIKRMGVAFKIRAEQATEIKDHMNDCKIPIILCGDFNDTPISYSYKILSSGLKDSYKEKGFGLETTYTGKLPFLRIDYILHSMELEATSYRSYKKFPSDHKLLTSRLRFNSN